MAPEQPRVEYKQEHDRNSVNEEKWDESEHHNLLQELQRRRIEHECIHSRSKWVTLAFGQFIALVATSMNASSYALEYGMHKVFPMFLLFNSYVVLMLHLFSRSKKHNEHPSLSLPHYESQQREIHCYHLPFTKLKLRTPWYYYFFLSCLDIGPNYLTLLALNKTSFTSATLLSSLTIPATMIFCRILMNKEHRRIHYVGVILCMIGGSVTVIIDKLAISSSRDETSHPHSYVGDILAILAALGYGVGDACAEFWSKHVCREEYLGMIGLFGAIYTFTAFLVSERNAVREAFTGDAKTVLETAGFIFWYTVSLVAYYVLESLFLMKSDATLLNLSLQTSNFWAVLFSVVAFRESPGIYFYIATCMVISGAFVYELYGNLENLGKPNDCMVIESSPLNKKERS